MDPGQPSPSIFLPKAEDNKQKRHVKNNTCAKRQKLNKSTISWHSFTHLEQPKQFWNTPLNSRRYSLCTSGKQLPPPLGNLITDFFMIYAQHIRWGMKLKLLRSQLLHKHGTGQGSTLPTHLPGILSSTCRSRFFLLPSTEASQHLKHFLIALFSQHIHPATKQRCSNKSSGTSRYLLMWSFSTWAGEEGF